MSWGPATVFIHMRKNFDGSSAKSKDLVHIDDDHSYNDDDDDDDTNAADDDDATDAADDDATENGAYQAATDDDDDEYDDDDDDDDDPVVRPTRRTPLLFLFEKVSSASRAFESDATARSFFPRKKNGTNTRGPSL